MEKNLNQRAERKARKEQLKKQKHLLKVKKAIQKQQAQLRKKNKQKPAKKLVIKNVSDKEAGKMYLIDILATFSFILTLIILAIAITGIIVFR